MLILLNKWIKLQKTKDFLIKACNLYNILCDKKLITLTLFMHIGVLLITNSSQKTKKILTNQNYTYHSGFQIKNDG